MLQFAFPTQVAVTLYPTKRPHPTKGGDSTTCVPKPTVPDQYSQSTPPHRPLANAQANWSYLAVGCHSAGCDTVLEMILNSSKHAKVTMSGMGFARARACVCVCVLALLCSGNPSTLNEMTASYLLHPFHHVPITLN